ncbi:hypothetical protein C1645_786834 [Glomus cerebriforme]|uniref:Uncharacterized protein n=1 Tax=Glomus cerebriforme TaxID=658196 RepID=A0A397SB61_9GLOM|nr:hypothetical protein C1645_786834 [Glomus cerebriforme]
MQGVQQEEHVVEFSNGQKENLEYHVKNFLFSFIQKQNKIKKSSELNMVKQDDIDNVATSDADNKTAGIISHPEIKFLNKL